MLGPTSWRFYDGEGPVFLRRSSPLDRPLDRDGSTRQRRTALTGNVSSHALMWWCLCHARLLLPSDIWTAARPGLHTQGPRHQGHACDLACGCGWCKTKEGDFTHGLLMT